MICKTIQELIEYGIQKELLTSDDSIYMRNQLMDLLHLSAWEAPSESIASRSLDEILDDLVAYACEQGIIAETNAAKDLFDTRIMGLFTSMPHEVIRRFSAAYQSSPEAATDWYYKYSQDTNYVRAGRISKDIRWTYTCEYGTLDITINRSKPEKDPRDIAAARNQPKTAYPACQLCMDNTGFAGTQTHPARQNLRPIPIQVNGEAWALQYSPYGYYNEHCIVFNQKHIPMKIDAAVFEKLFDVLDFLPHYFIGSNADLPIVGGSILSHEHFQGGHYTFAMEKAPVETPFLLPDFPEVQAGIVKWPMSVIRLQSENRTALAGACDRILTAWRQYSDPEAGIFSETDGTPHNTITPIARMRGRLYECDLVLRNNLTTADRPLGVFHPNPSLHHIKKENIGLIEVMGLAVLPARLATELPLLEKALYTDIQFQKDDPISCHTEWIAELKERYPDANEQTAGEIIRQEIGAVFEEVLLDAGVFKRDEIGKQHFSQFVETLKQDTE
ncbi:MAG: UDP-glucose--hexose-1-phosphate uridylyltransferase [Ruminococcus sp.]